MMHRHIFDDRALNHRYGWFFANVCMGVSSKWWRDDHNEHHLFTNTVISDVGRTDPQAAEEIWAQNPILFQFFDQRLLSFLIRIQHIIFIPALVFVGPHAMKIDAFISEKRWWEWVGFGLHWVWTGALLSLFPTIGQGVGFYYLASCGLGVRCTSSPAAKLLLTTN
jgi:delta8-fatty-acid desaturase